MDFSNIVGCISGRVSIKLLCIAMRIEVIYSIKRSHSFIAISTRTTWAHFSSDENDFDSDFLFIFYSCCYSKDDREVEGRIILSSLCSDSSFEDVTWARK